MDYEQEIKRLRRLNMKMYFTMSNIISVLNNTETEELYKITMTSIDKDMIITKGYDDIYKEILLEIKQLKEESKNLRNKMGNLEMNNESLTNRIRMLEEDFERLKKAQLDKYFTHTKGDSTDSE